MRVWGKQRVRRLGLWLVWTLILAPACNSSSTGSTTAVTTTTPGTTTTTRGPAVMPTFPNDADLIVVDDAATVGTLDNGLVFYIRENTAPGGRAQLRLVVKAGSVHESDEQAGVAHYLEHMMFNGTASFPANELVTVLQRFGAEFGPDINAYTSFEETVYMLELPTDDPATLETGFDVLLEWATAATLDPEQVDLERGVLLEEWRIRDQGFWGRYFAGVTDILLAGTPYENRLPLAAPDQLDDTTPDHLTDFYENWYRPDLMAIVAVGDFDSSLVEELIRDRFTDVAGPADPLESPDLFTNPFADPAFLVLADPEAADSFVELNYPVPHHGPTATVGGLRRDLALSAAFDMLATRLYEDTLRGVTPYFDPSRATNELVRTQGTDGVGASANPDDLAATAEALLTEVERVRRFGFNQGELDRVIRAMRSDVESEYDEFRTKQDGQFAADYVEHFLGGTPAAEAREWRDLQLRLIDEMTLDQVGATFAATIEATQPLVIVAGPEASTDAIPDETALIAIVDAVAAADLQPREDDTTEVEALMEIPDPAQVVARTELSDSVVPDLVFANGLRFIAWPTNIHEGHAELIAASPGGWVTLDGSDVAEAQLLGDLMLASGVGELDQVSLERALVGMDVYLEPYIDEVWEGFGGSVDTTDLETLFQLIHLYMTAPRFDEVAVPIVQNRLRQQVESPETLADTALELEIADARFSGDPRFSPLPSADELASLDLARAAAVFDDRFGNPGDFVFVLVGDFEPATAEYLASRYLGTISGGGDREGFIDERPAAPDGVVTRIVEAGTGERGAVTLLFSTERSHSPDDRVRLDILEAVIELRLVTHIREELSASYSPGVSIDLIEEPKDGVEVSIRIDGDPAGLDVVLEALLADLTDLTRNGPTNDEFAIAQEQVFRNYELINNLQLAEAMVFSAFHTDELLTEIDTRYDRVIAATRVDIRNSARQVVTLDDYIEVRLIPIGFDG